MVGSVAEHLDSPVERLFALVVLAFILWLINGLLFLRPGVRAFRELDGDTAARANLSLTFWLGLMITMESGVLALRLSPQFIELRWPHILDLSLYYMLGAVPLAAGILVLIHWLVMLHKRRED